MKVPARFQDLVAPASLAGLEAALAPTHRTKTAFDVEVEAVGEGTFTLSSSPAALTAKKGFAKQPLLSVRLDKGFMPLLQDQLQAAVDGFPKAPPLRDRLKALRGLPERDLDAVVAAIAALKTGTAIHFNVKGAGILSVARGPLDEAERELTVQLEASALQALLAGAAPSTVSATLKGDRSVGASVIGALGALWKILQG